MICLITLRGITSINFFFFFFNSRDPRLEPLTQRDGDTL